MIIKDSFDVARMLVQRQEEFDRLGPNMRIYLVDQTMNLYHRLRQAEGCKVEYSLSWTTNDRKEELKREFCRCIESAKTIADFIDGELERTRIREESIAGGYLNFDVMNEMNTVEEQIQYINDVMSKQG